MCGLAMCLQQLGLPLPLLLKGRHTFVHKELLLMGRQGSVALGHQVQAHHSSLPTPTALPVLLRALFHVREEDREGMRRALDLEKLACHPCATGTTSLPRGLWRHGETEKRPRHHECRCRTGDGATVPAQEQPGARASLWDTHSKGCKVIVAL